jgi:hypothetical protein
VLRVLLLSSHDDENERQTRSVTVATTKAYRASQGEQRERYIALIADCCVYWDALCAVRKRDDDDDQRWCGGALRNVPCLSTNRIDNV